MDRRHDPGSVSRAAGGMPSHRQRRTRSNAMPGRIAVVFTAILLSSAALAASPGVPNIDAKAACRGASDTPQDKSQVQSCLDAEVRIRKQLTENWGHYSAASRSQCGGEMAHAYHASYVELISCLEMANPDMMKSKPAQ
jgi:hypothetical protein